MTAIQIHPTTAATPAVPTRALLSCAAVSGPLWAAASLVQAATRAGFDLTRHPLSMLSTGDLGWLQMSNFVIAGLLTIAGAIGLRRTLRAAPGGRWTPRLVAVAGAGMVVAGLFVLDPGDGFPAGTPAGAPATLSGHALVHLAAGTVTFLALIAACLVLGRHFARTGHRGTAIVSRLAGLALLAGNTWAMTGGAAGSATLAAGYIAAILWISAVAARLRTTRPS